jgi:hypothetical protein
MITATATRLLAFLVALVGAAAPAARAQPSRLPSLDERYQVVFEDDFRYPSVDSLLSPRLRKWAPEHTWGNAFWDPNTKCSNVGPGNVAYRREDIRLVPDPTDPQDRCAALDFTYHADPIRQIMSQTTGEVKTGEFRKTSGLLRAMFRGDSLCPEEGFKYGIFEIRCRMPNVPGLQAAFWFWNGYGACGQIPPGWTTGDSWEVDVFETYNNNGTRVFFGTLQPNPLRQHLGSSTYYEFAQPTDPATSFHTYTLVWTPNTLAWYLDGRIFKRLRNPRTGSSNPVGVPNTEMSLILSAHYQWDCKNNYHCELMPDSVTRNDQQCPQPNDPFLIDYVRVYRPTTLNPDGTWPLVERRRPRAAPTAGPTVR